MAHARLSSPAQQVATSYASVQKATEWTAIAYIELEPNGILDEIIRRFPWFVSYPVGNIGRPRYMSIVVVLPAGLPSYRNMDLGKVCVEQYSVGYKLVGLGI